MKLIFPSKHWLTTLLISPIFLIIYDSVADTQFVFDEPSIYMLFITMGAVISLPGLLIYYLTYKHLITTELSNFQIRLYLIAVASAMAIIAFWLIQGSLMIPMMLSYLTGVAISAWFYPVRGNKAGNSR
jgi:hypothetical protein